VRKASWALAVPVLLIAAACSPEDEGPLPVPSSAFPSPTIDGDTGPTGDPGPGGSGATGSPGLPTTSPGAGAGTLTSGSFAFQTSGDLEVERTLPMLVTAVYTPPPGGFALVWTAGGLDATVAGMGGGSFVGTRPTSPVLTLVLTVETAEGISSFLSTNGECDVTMAVATEDRVAGDIRCTHLSSDAGDEVDVSARFEAAG
jgi:hypothetical protein